MTEKMIEQYEETVDLLLEAEDELQELNKFPRQNEDAIEYCMDRMKRLNRILDRLEGQA